MAYASNTDVQALISTYSITLGASSIPTTTTVDGWCTQYSYVVDGVLRAKGYGTVPVTAAGDIGAITPYVAMRAAADTWMKHFGVADDQPQHVDEWLKQWEWFIGALAEGTFWLPTQNPSSQTFSISVPKVYGA